MIIKHRRPRKLSERRARLEAQVLNPFYFDEAREAQMYLITDRKLSAEIDEDGRAKTVSQPSARITADKVEVDQLLLMRKHLDDRMRNVRVFWLEIDEDGSAMVGAEIE